MSHQRSRTAAALALICLAVAGANNDPDYGVHSERVTIPEREWLPDATERLYPGTGRMDAVDLHMQFMVLWATGEGRDRLTWEVCTEEPDGERCWEASASQMGSGTASSTVWGYHMGCAPVQSPENLVASAGPCPDRFVVKVRNTGTQPITAGLKTCVGMILSSQRNRSQGRVGGAWAARLRNVYNHVYAVPVPANVNLGVYLSPKALPSDGLTSMLVRDASRPLEYSEVIHTDAALAEEQRYDVREEEFQYQLLWVAPEGDMLNGEQLEYELVISGPSEFWTSDNWVSIVMICIACMALLFAAILTALIVMRRCRLILRRVRTRRSAARERVQRSSVIENLELKTFAQVRGEIGEEDQACCICMEEYKPRDRVRVLNCKHHFHKDCVGRWLEDHWSCPLCNQNIDVAENRYLERALVLDAAAPHAPRSPPANPPAPNSHRPSPHTMAVRGSRRHPSDGSELDEKTHEIELSRSGAGPPRRPSVRLLRGQDSPTLDRGPPASAAFGSPGPHAAPPLPDEAHARQSYHPPGRDIENPNDSEMPGSGDNMPGRMRRG